MASIEAALEIAIWSLTAAKYSENGSPRSRANAHVNRDVDAMIPKLEQKEMMIIADIITVAPFVEPVA